jgi:DNA-binding NarL/FixJ family response regulator
MMMGGLRRRLALWLMPELNKKVPTPRPKAGEEYRGFRLGCLGSRQVDAWLLKQEGLTIEQIGKKMGLKTITVRGYLSLVRHTLREEVKA